MVRGHQHQFSEEDNGWSLREAYTESGVKNTGSSMLDKSL